MIFPKISKNLGFTLLEVMVALIVVAIGLSAVVKTATQNAENIRYLRDKTLAHWVAMNKLTELQVRGQWPDLGSQTDVAMMADRKWYVMIMVSDTMDLQLRRLEITVKEKEESSTPLVVLVGFIEGPI